MFHIALRQCETHSQCVSLASVSREPLKLSLLHSIVFHIALRHEPVRRQYGDRTCYCVPVRYVGTSYASASARVGILSARRAGAHRTDYIVAISKTIVNSRSGRLPCLCRPSIAFQSVLYVPVWDLHNVGSLESWNNGLALCGLI